MLWWSHCPGQAIVNDSAMAEIADLEVGIKSQFYLEDQATVYLHTTALFTRRVLKEEIETNPTNRSCREDDRVCAPYCD